MIVGELPAVVADSRGVPFRLVRQLGAGGQGIVYEVEGGDFAVKILNATGEGSRDRLARVLRSVKLQPLQDLRVARPLETLSAPFVGYVMTHLDGMAPLTDLAAYPRGVDVGAWFSTTGGLRGRFAVLSSMAATVAGLHERGLMYVDPSPANVFWRIDAGEAEAWLIDADNIRAEGSAGDVLCTRFWAAPELAAQQGVPSSLSDSWSTAVLAFAVLTLTHPLLGDAVDQGPPEAEDDALLGKLPWIDDPDDRTNASSAGLPRHLVLTRRLWDLVSRMFGAGRVQPSSRPSSIELARELERARRLLTGCDRCGEPFLFTSTRTCSWCGLAQSGRTLGRFYFRERNLHGDAAKPIELEDRVVLGPGESLMLSRGLCGYTSADQTTRQALRLRRSGDRVAADLLEDLAVAVEKGSRATARRAGESIDLGSTDEQIVLRLGDPHGPHRLLVLGEV